MMLAYCLIERGTPAAQAHAQAMDLIEALRGRGFDIVHNSWVDGPLPPAERLSWDDIGPMADQIEKEFGRKPWMP
jgi:hypothetical protein